jgi:hypothetical protein
MNSTSYRTKPKHHHLFVVALTIAQNQEKFGRRARDSHWGSESLYASNN